MKSVLQSIALVLVYLAAAKISLVFATVSGNATVFWAPGGIALGWLLLAGPRLLPAVFAGAYLAAISVGNPFVVCLGTALGNSLETALAWYLLRHCCNFDTQFQRLRDLMLLIILGAFFPAMLSAMFGSLSLLQAGFIESAQLPRIIWNWWRADVLSLVFFTPLILIFAQRNRFLPQGARLWEYLALWGIAVVCGSVVILGWSPGVRFEPPPQLAWLIPVILWAGLRTGRRNTGLIQLTLMGMSLSSAYYNTGFFADEFVRFGFANFWMVGMVLATLGMALAIMANQQRKAIQDLAMSAKVFNVASDGVLITDADNRIVAVNPSFTQITGYAAGEVIGQDPGMLGGGRQDRDFYQNMWQTLKRSGQWQGEVWNRRKDGELYLEKLSIHTLTDSRGRVIHRIGIFSDITQHRAEQDAIVHRAQHDFLTGLPNRLLFQDRFGQQLALAHRHDTKFALIYLDLDKFKPVNDTLGHHTGDQLLVAVAERLSGLVREIDTVSRFGGDEFAILVSEVSTLQDVTTLADKILVALCTPFQLDKHVITVSGSLGITLYPDHGRDMESLMQRADAAMYRAKHQGCNSYAVAQGAELETV